MIFDDHLSPASLIRGLETVKLRAPPGTYCSQKRAKSSMACLLTKGLGPIWLAEIGKLVNLKARGLMLCHLANLQLHSFKKKKRAESSTKKKSRCSTNLSLTKIKQFFISSEFSCVPWSKVAFYWGWETSHLLIGILISWGPINPYGLGLSFPSPIWK